MRQLSPSEKRLALIVGAMFFLVVNLYFLPKLRATQQSLEAKIATYKAQTESAGMWLNKKSLWDTRAAWLKEKQPKMTSATTAQSSLLESMSTTAKEGKLKIESQKLVDMKSDPAYEEVSAAITVSGSLENVVKWITTVQSAPQFQAITSLSMKTVGDKSESGPPDIRCELQVARWFAPKGA